MADFNGYSHRLAEFGDRNQIIAMGAEDAGIEFFAVPNDDLARVSLDLEDVEGRAGSDAQSLALADGEIVDASMFADDTAVGSDHFAGSFERRLALLGEIGVEELLIVSAGHEADFLRVGFLGNDERMLAREFADFRLGHPAEREHGAAELFLRESEQEVGLILGVVDGTLEEPAPRGFVEYHLCVVSGSDTVSANLPGYNKKLVKLQVIVAETAGDGRASGKVLVDEGTDNVALETLFVIDHVVGDADGFGHAARIVDVVEGTATSLDRLGHAFVPGETALIPELHRQADDIVAVGAKHGRDYGGINSSGHSDGDGGSNGQH